MFGFFSPRYVKEGRIFVKNARKMLHYKRDIWSEATVVDFEKLIEKLEKGIREHDQKTVEEAAQELDTMAGKFSPPAKDAALRENCEVFLVAIVIAIGIRSYFLQPFTIPTGSMQPTLNGIIGTPTPNEPLPNVFVRVVDFFWRGRNYIEAVSSADDVIIGMEEVTRFRFLTFTTITCEKQKFTLWAPPDTLRAHFNIHAMREIHAGEVVARGWVGAGDHVFVDKLTYNFRAPHHGDVFVFNTKGIPTHENVSNPGAPSQFYIKRLAGLPGDTLRIHSPNLFINGEIAKDYGFQRVMARQGDYHGYSQGPDSGYLNAPESSVKIPPQNYFALGDNSYNSSDSRYWGFVPQQNIMGRGMFVYLPFWPHFGLIK